MASDSKYLYNYIAKASFNGSVIGLIEDGFEIEFDKTVFTQQDPESSVPNDIYIDSETPSAVTTVLQLDTDIFESLFGATPGSFLRGQSITSRAAELKIEPLYGNGHILTIKKALASPAGAMTIKRGQLVSLPVIFETLAAGEYNEVNWSLTNTGRGGIGQTARHTEYEKIRSYIMATHTRFCWITNTMDETYVPGMGLPAVMIEEVEVEPVADNPGILAITLALSIYEFSDRDPHGHFAVSLSSDLHTTLTRAFVDIKNTIATIGINGFYVGSNPPELVNNNPKLQKSQLLLRIFISEVLE